MHYDVKRVIRSIEKKEWKNISKIFLKHNSTVFLAIAYSISTAQRIILSIASIKCFSSKKIESLCKQIVPNKLTFPYDVFVATDFHCIQTHVRVRRIICTLLLVLCVPV